MAEKGVPIVSILARGGWASMATFLKFYARSLGTIDFSEVFEISSRYNQGALDVYNDPEVVRWRNQQSFPVSDRQLVKHTHTQPQPQQQQQQLCVDQHSTQLSSSHQEGVYNSRGPSGVKTHPIDMSRAEGYVPAQPSNPVSSAVSSQPKSCKDAVVVVRDSPQRGDDFDPQVDADSDDCEDAVSDEVEISDTPITCTKVTSPSSSSAACSSEYSPSRHTSTPTQHHLLQPPTPTTQLQPHTPTTTTHHPQQGADTPNSAASPATSFVLDRSVFTIRRSPRIAEKAGKRSLSADSNSPTAVDKKKQKQDECSGGVRSRSASPRVGEAGGV